MDKKEGGKEHMDDKFKEVIEKYNINIDKLKREQEKLAKNLEIKDEIDFSLVNRIGGIDNVFFKNKIISAVVVLSGDEILEQEYFSEKVRFPYISGFRAYRELPSMISCFNKLDEKPDIIFIRGQGILHPRRLGLASHFSLSANVPTIGVTDTLLVGEVKGEDIFLNGKVSGKVIKTKEGARPLFVSPGNLISVDTAASLVRKFTKEPHKFPEPLRLAKRHAREIRKELF